MKGIARAGTLVGGSAESPSRRDRAGIVKLRLGMAAWADDELTTAQLSRIPLSRCHHQSRWSSSATRPWRTATPSAPFPSIAIRRSTWAARLT